MALEGRPVTLGRELLSGRTGLGPEVRDTGPEVRWGSGLFSSWTIHFWELLTDLLCVLNTKL
jgi:hypothetical protein